MKRLKLIANPASGNGRARRIAAQAVELLGRKRLEFDVEFTIAPRHAAEIAARACDDYDAIVAIGGDGTIHEVASGMLGCAKPLGVVPAGSGNDFVKSLNVPNDTAGVVEVLLAGRTKMIDVGTVNGACFVNVVGIGFDAAVNHASHNIRFPASGFSRYFFALMKTLGTYAPARCTVTIDGITQTQDLFLLTIGNGTTCGGGFRLTPRAELDDGLLDVTTVKPIGVLPLLWHLPKVIRGTLDRVPRYAAMTRAASIRVESEQPLPVHIDGEIYRGNARELRIEILPKALTVIGNF